MKPYPAVSYADYLKINELLELQKRRSVEFGAPAHDETLFIITHQAYELWFKQILTEIDSVLAIFGNANSMRNRWAPRWLDSTGFAKFKNF